MRDIFNNYNTGLREWTYERKLFEEGEFYSTFEALISNELQNEASTTFRVATHIDVMMFSVPMNRSHAGLHRNVIFIQQINSQYWNMASFLSPDDYSESLNRAFDDAYSGMLCEYDIIDLIEPDNDKHQRVLIETWFDISNWFDILTSYEGIAEIENIINGNAPEALNAAADTFVPELTPLQLQALQMRALNLLQPAVPVAHWNVQDLL